MLQPAGKKIKKEVAPTQSQDAAAPSEIDNASDLAPELALVPYDENRKVAVAAGGQPSMLVSDGSDDEGDAHGWLKSVKDARWAQKVPTLTP